MCVLPRLERRRIRTRDGRRREIPVWMTAEGRVWRIADARMDELGQLHRQESPWGLTHRAFVSQGEVRVYRFHAGESQTLDPRWLDRQLSEAVTWEPPGG